jgi:hypothetical protein
LGEKEATGGEPAARRRAAGEGAGEDASEGGARRRHALGDEHVAGEEAAPLRLEEAGEAGEAGNGSVEAGREEEADSEEGPRMVVEDSEEGPGMVVEDSEEGPGMVVEDSEEEVEARGVVWCCAACVSGAWLHASASGEKAGVACLMRMCALTCAGGTTRHDDAAVLSLGRALSHAPFSHAARAFCRRACSRLAASRRATASDSPPMTARCRDASRRSMRSASACTRACSAAAASATFRATSASRSETRRASAAALRAALRSSSAWRCTCVRPTTRPSTSAGVTADHHQYHQW